MLRFFVELGLVYLVLQAAVLGSASSLRAGSGTEQAGSSSSIRTAASAGMYVPFAPTLSPTATDISSTPTTAPTATSTTTPEFQWDGTGKNPILYADTLQLDAQYGPIRFDQEPERSQIIQATTTGQFDVVLAAIHVRSPFRVTTIYYRPGFDWNLSADTTEDPFFGANEPGQWVAWAYAYDSNGQIFMTNSVTWYVVDVSNY